MSAGESVRLQLQQDQHSLCFGQPVFLLCKLSGIMSGMFSASRPSWKEDGIIFAIDGNMYHSVTQTNQTQAVLELVPERSHFEPSGTHNYTCFFPLVGGGILESNPVQISPISKLHCSKSVFTNCFRMLWINSCLHNIIQ